MNAASLELCKELYELSGWMDLNVRQKYDRKGGFWHSFDHFDLDHDTPAYYLGYLLRKLPPNIGEYRLTLTQYFTAKGKTPDGWQAYYKTDQSYLGLRYAQEADNPEDAAAKLAIELFDQGVLKP